MPTYIRRYAKGEMQLGAKYSAPITLLVPMACNQASGTKHLVQQMFGFDSCWAPSDHFAFRHPRRFWFHLTRFRILRSFEGFVLPSISHFAPFAGNHFFLGIRTSHLEGRQLRVKCFIGTESIYMYICIRRPLPELERDNWHQQSTNTF